MSNQFPHGGEPVPQPIIQSIYDFSTNALGQLKLWFGQDPPSIPLSQISGFQQLVYKKDTAFPTGTLKDGQLFTLVVDATNGIYWNFRYDATSASSYKWIFTGGPPATSRVETDEATTSLTYAALATAGPSFTLPSAGDYTVGIGMELGATQNGTDDIYMSYDIGGTGAVDADAVYTNGGKGGTCSTFKTKTGLSAVTLTAKYRNDATGGLSISRRKRWMQIQPIRVAG